MLKIKENDGFLENIEALTGLPIGYSVIVGLSTEPQDTVTGNTQHLRCCNCDGEYRI